MKATAELQIVPIGDGVSVRKEITRVVEPLQGHDFVLEPMLPVPISKGSWPGFWPLSARSMKPCTATVPSAWPVI